MPLITSSVCIHCEPANGDRRVLKQRLAQPFRLLLQNMNEALHDLVDVRRDLATNLRIKGASENASYFYDPLPQPLRSSICSLARALISCYLPRSLHPHILSPIALSVDGSARHLRSLVCISSCYLLVHRSLALLFCTCMRTLACVRSWCVREVTEQ